MHINKQKAELLKARYRERCKRFNIYNVPDLSIHIANERGFIIAKNYTHELIDIRVSNNGEIHSRYCSSYLRDLVTAKNLPFETNLTD